MSEKRCELLSARRAAFEPGIFQRLNTDTPAAKKSSAAEQYINFACKESSVWWRILAYKPTQRGESTVKRTVGCHGNQGKKGIHLERGLVQVSVRELVWVGFWRRQGLWEDVIMLECGPLGWWSVVAARERCGSGENPLCEWRTLDFLLLQLSLQGTEHRFRCRLGIYTWGPKHFINANEPTET